MVLAVLPMAIRQPFVAYLLWAWTGLLVPTAYFYGFMADARVNLIMALLTITLIALGRVKWADYQRSPMVALYVLFVLHAGLAVAFAYPGVSDNVRYYEYFVKGMVCCLTMPFVIRERVHFHAFLLVFALGLGVHGVLNGLKVLASGGGHNMLGPQGTMLTDRNHLSTALVLTLPLIFYLQSYCRARWLRLAMLGSMLLIIAAILGGGSRAGFIALSVVAMWFFITTRHKLKAAFAIVFVFGLFLSFAPDNWIDRLETIKSADEDSSFMGRVVAWKISSAIALANPVYGGGLHSVQVQYIWDMYKSAPSLLDGLGIPVPEFSAKAAHSIYFELMGDQGFVGLAIFLSILFRGIWCRFQVKRMVGLLGSQYQWARDMADMLMLSIVAYMVGGAAVSIGYLEAIYMIVMLSELLRLNVSRAFVQNQPRQGGLRGW